MRPVLQQATIRYPPAQGTSEQRGSRRHTHVIDTRLTTATEENIQSSSYVRFAPGGPTTVCSPEAGHLLAIAVVINPANARQRIEQRTSNYCCKIVSSDGKVN